MTREEIIEQQTFVYYETCSDEDIAKSKGFIDGAQWADQHPREGLWDANKVTEWLENHVREFKYYDSDCSDGNIDVDGLIETLTKTMKE